MGNAIHNIEPVYNSESKVLILGSFPSVKSREAQFFYGHPMNRFWKVMATILGEDVPDTIEKKKALLINNKIAVWDVIQSCDIEGSSDSSIKNVVPNDIRKILDNSSVSHVFANGDKSFRLYMKYCYEKTGVEALKLPSTSTANAAYKLENLVEKWQIISQILQK